MSSYSRQQLEDDEQDLRKRKKELNELNEILNEMESPFYMFKFFEVRRNEKRLRNLLCPASHDNN